VPPGPHPDEQLGTAPGTLGSALRSAREAAGLSVEQVAAATRIRGTLIRDLEADRLVSSGAAVYARGHVRSIAGAVRADPAPLLLLCDAAGATSASGPGMVAAEPARREHPRGGSVLLPPSPLRVDRSGPRWGLALVGALGVLTAVFLLGQAGPGPDQRGTTSVGQLGASGTPSAPSPTAAKPTRVAPTLDPGAVAKLPPPTGAQLRVRLIGAPSWVLVRSGSTVLFEGVLPAGAFRDFSDPALLRIKVGNAAAVNLNCGGRDGGSAGGAGMIASFTCTAGGLSPA